MIDKSEKKRTLILGASPKPIRYSNMAVKKLTAYNHPIVALGKRESLVDDIVIESGKPELSGIHTVTLYLNPSRQVEYYDYILGLEPKRIIFNPGTENPELMKMAKEKGIEVVQACTLVMLSTDQY